MVKALIDRLTIFIQSFLFYTRYNITIFSVRVMVFIPDQVTPDQPAQLPENKSATRLPFLFHSHPPTSWTDPTRQANNQQTSELVPFM